VPYVLSDGFVPQLVGDIGRRQVGIGRGGTRGRQATFRDEPGIRGSVKVIGTWIHSRGIKRSVRTSGAGR